MRERPEGQIAESTHFHGPNMVIYEIISGAQRTPLIGGYLPLSTLYHLPDIEEALNLLLGRDTIIMGDLNADIGRLQNLWNQQVAYFLSSFGLFDLLGHFRQQLRFCYMQTWWKVQQRKLLRST